MMTRSKSRKLKQNNSANSNLQAPCIQNNANDVAKAQQHLQRVEDSPSFMLYNDDDMDIEGLKYSDIEKNPYQKQYLQRLRANLPQYGLLSSHQKFHYFKKLSIQYEDQINTTGNEVKKEKEKNSRLEKKQVSFNTNQKFVVFDKSDIPKDVKYLQEHLDNTKF